MGSAEPFFQIFECDRRVINRLHTYVVVGTGGRGVTVDVAMYVCLETSQTLRVNRDVRKDDVIQHPDTIDFIEVGQVVLRPINIVVATYQPFVTVTHSYQRYVFPPHSHVAKMVDVILRPNYRVPSGDHVEVHFFHACKGPDRGAVFLLEVEDVSMPEMCIAQHPNVCHLPSCVFVIGRGVAEFYHVIRSGRGPIPIVI